jgi:hypothetical protein
MVVKVKIEPYVKPGRAHHMKHLVQLCMYGLCVPVLRALNDQRHAHVANVATACHSNVSGFNMYQSTAYAMSIRNATGLAV